jgi:DNA-binding MarR family transcriptional regulator
MDIQLQSSKTEIAKETRSVNLKSHDLSILTAIHEREGMLSLSQIVRRFFTSLHTARRHMTQLWKEGSVDRATHRQPMPLAEDTIYWLTKKGAKLVAESYRIPFANFSYWSQPRWSQIDHDLAINDFRLDIEEAVKQSTDVFFGAEWICSRDFARHYDRIEYTDDHGRRKKCGIVPDGFFALEDIEFNFPFLLEIDMGTEDNPRFGREKILPGKAYIRSDAYYKRCGYKKTGRFLIVTSSQRRLQNMKAQTERLVSIQEAKRFLFTTFDALHVDTVLSMPVWYPGGFDYPVTLLQRI